MFSFHKPRVYRSTEGCCICRAKSSSSRFTDSKKYENDSMKCFNLKQPRFGEICNACVLLVKRYKRLPVGSNRHWGHVVDARSGPGTKSLTKYKKHRDDADTNIAQQTTYNKSFITEKFSKIFKKNKKVKTSLSPQSSSSSCSSKRKSTVPASSASSKSWVKYDHSHHDQQSLPSTPDSLDSDYEDSHIATPTSTIVEFQTQTRASAHRSRNTKINPITSCPTKKCVTKPIGSIRRKCMPPRKRLRAIIDNDVQFYDRNEWQQLQSCCGPVLECQALGGAIIVELENFKPCVEHQRDSSSELKPMQTQTPMQQPPQKTIIATTPAVVQLATTSTAPTKSTQVLKKHHLFFKRQSECFPHADLGAINAIQNEIAKNNTAKKTDLQILTTSTTSTAISLKTPTSTDLTNFSLPTHAPTSINNTLQPATMTKNSTAKITTIAPVGVGSSNNYAINNKPSSNFLHKIKTAADSTGKIIKHSHEKINTVVRLNDLNDMRNIINAVDRSYLLNNSKTHQNQTSSAASQQHVMNHQQQSHAHISIIAAGQQAAASLPSPTTLSHNLSIATTSLAPKFSDNSSDSGFDENLQDRKSASPLQEDTEKKILTRPSIHNGKKLYLTAGVNFYGQSQSMQVSAGIDDAMSMRQKNRQQAAAVSQIRNQNQNQRLPSNTSGVKIAQIVSNSSASQKMHIRALYNNNTIKHENGVTTILPASSLAASSQTAAMSALVAPSSVTITPAPATSITNLNGKKISITNTGGQSCSNNHLSHVSAATHINSSHLNTIGNNLTSLNQKIIFVKTAKYNGNPVTSASSLNNLHITTTTPASPTTLNNAISQQQNLCKH